MCLFFLFCVVHTALLFIFGLTFVKQNLSENNSFIVDIYGIDSKRTAKEAPAMKIINWIVMRR